MEEFGGISEQSARQELSWLPTISPGQPLVSAFSDCARGELTTIFHQETPRPGPPPALSASAMRPLQVEVRGRQLRHPNVETLGVAAGTRDISAARAAGREITMPAPVASRFGGSCQPVT